MTDPRASGLAPYVAFVACTVVWGSTWLAIKVGYEAVPAFTGAGIRFLIAGVILLAVGLALRVPLPRGRAEWGLAVFVGVVLFGIDYGLIYWGEQYLASGLTSVIFASLPFWTLLLAAGYGLERLTTRKLVGILVGVAGVTLLFYDRLELGRARLLPFVAVVLSAVCAGAASVATKRHGANMHPVALNAPAMLVGAAVLFLWALLAGEDVGLPSSPIGWYSVLYLALAGSVVTFLLYFWLLKRWDASRASFISMGTPVTALALGAVFLDEPVTGRVLAGAALVLLGIYVATAARRGPSPAPPVRND